jgi:hypothetical protein
MMEPLAVSDHALAFHASIFFLHTVMRTFLIKSQNVHAKIASNLEEVQKKA